jgi:photosystem II stability/assembly factor-like uncharacterized protein
LIISSSDGIYHLDKADGTWSVVDHFFSGEAFTCVSSNGGIIQIGSRTGTQRSTNAGKSWQVSNQGLSNLNVRWLDHHEQADLVFAGTEPAGIFVSRDGGLSWVERPEVADLREKNGWFLPYSPGAGCVRGFAFHGNSGYAAVEVGGALQSDDFGENWRLVGGSTGIPEFGPPEGSGVHADVHSIYTHPSSSELVYAPTGGGFFRSRDSGETWQFHYRCYCRAAWINPHDPEHILLGPADSVDQRGRIEESRDGGASWFDVSEDIGTPWPDHMVERFLQTEDELLAILSNGEMLISLIDVWKWRRFHPEITGVTSATEFTMDANAAD